MENYIEINISSGSLEQKEILIALLSNEGYDGFEETETSVKACIEENKFDKEILEQILSPFPLQYTQQLIAPRNWNAEWESGYQPVIVEEIAAVRAHFHQPIKGVKYEIIITPKMSFGTGHHATTWQMMKLMQQIDFSNKKVFDFGCGTGVLSILAEKMGAAEILATDIDDWCIENTVENAANNQCAKIKAVQSDVPPMHQRFDVILANINRHILLQFINELASLLAANGYLFISGFYAEENHLLIEEANKHGLQLRQTSERHNWSSLMLQKTNAS
ncbi:MAG: 50S ribosomal protein L11 methyltransferase [Chitinophagaceae bacterium]|nr:50S ribosomal protein L11 methyltransferase [Chitinophagaceae bacterium]